MFVCVLCCDPSEVRITSHHIARCVGCVVVCVCVYFVCVCLLASAELLKVYRACFMWVFDFAHQIKYLPGSPSFNFDLDLVMRIVSLIFSFTIKRFTIKRSNDKKRKPEQFSKYKEERFSNCLRSKNWEGSKRRDENMTYKTFTSAGHLKQC